MRVESVQGLHDQCEREDEKRVVQLSSKAMTMYYVSHSCACRQVGVSSDRGENSDMSVFSVFLSSPIAIRRT